MAKKNGKQHDQPMRPRTVHTIIKGREECFFPPPRAQRDKPTSSPQKKKGKNTRKPRGRP